MSYYTPEADIEKVEVYSTRQPASVFGWRLRHPWQAGMQHSSGKMPFPVVEPALR